MEAADEKVNAQIAKGKKKGLVLFLIGFSMLLVVSIGGWNPVIFILSQIFMILGIFIRYFNIIKERKKNPVSEPKWVKHLRQ